MKYLKSYDQVVAMDDTNIFIIKGDTIKLLDIYEEIRMYNIILAGWLRITEFEFINALRKVKDSPMYNMTAILYYAKVKSDTETAQGPHRISDYE